MLNIQNLSDTAQGSLWGMVAGAGIVVKFVLIMLFAFSILSWAIIIYKYRLIRKMEKESAKFIEFFWQKKQFASIFDASSNYRFSPLARVFAAGYKELLQATAQKKDVQPNIHFNIGEMDSIQRALKKAISCEIGRLEKAVSFLATTGNTANKQEQDFIF